MTQILFERVQKKLYFSCAFKYNAENIWARQE